MRNILGPPSYTFVDIVNFDRRANDLRDRLSPQRGRSDPAATPKPFPRPSIEPGRRKKSLHTHQKRRHFAFTTYNSPPSDLARSPYRNETQRIQRCPFFSGLRLRLGRGGAQCARPGIRKLKRELQYAKRGSLKRLTN